MIIDHVQPASHVPNTLNMLNKFGVKMEVSEDFTDPIQLFAFSKDGITEIVQIPYEDLVQDWMFLQPDHWGIRYVGGFLCRNFPELSDEVEAYIRECDRKRFEESIENRMAEERWRNER